VARVAEIEQSLLDATQFETRVKVAADFGPVWKQSLESAGTRS
jgi:hypothetical protein